MSVIVIVGRVQDELWTIHLNTGYCAWWVEMLARIIDIMSTVVALIVLKSFLSVRV
jgi:hypothetical protein